MQFAAWSMVRYMRTTINGRTLAANQGRNLAPSLRKKGRKARRFIRRLLFFVLVKVLFHPQRVLE